MKKIACPNCGRTISTTYCPRCGQRYGEARLSWRNLWEGAMSTYIGEGFDGEKGTAERFGMLGTLWQTLRHPVRTVTNFLAGQRRKYFNPIALLLLLSGFCALASSLFGVRYIDALTVPESTGYRPFEYVKTANEYANSHPATYMLLSIPVLALVCKWIFRPRKLRYIEFFYIEIFTSVISVIILFVTSFIPMGIDESVKTGLQSLPVFCIEAAVYRQIFRRSIFRTVINLAVVYGITTVSLIIIVAAVLLTAGIVF